MWYYIDHFVTSCQLGNCKTRILLELDKYLLSLSWMSAIYWHSKDKPIWSVRTAKCLILCFCESSIGWYFITVKIFTYYLSIFCNQLNMRFVFTENIFVVSNLAHVFQFPLIWNSRTKYLYFYEEEIKFHDQKNESSNKLFMPNP